MELEKIVNELNENIKVFDIRKINWCIHELVDNGYVHQHEAQHLFDDILNDRCPIPLSSFKEDE